MAAITTSPKARGVSSVCSVLIQGEEKERLAMAMEEHGRRKSINKEIFWIRLFVIYVTDVRFNIYFKKMDFIFIAVMNATWFLFIRRIVKKI